MCRDGCKRADPAWLVWAPVPVLALCLQVKESGALRQRLAVAGNSWPAVVLDDAMMFGGMFDVMPGASDNGCMVSHFGRLPVVSGIGMAAEYIVSALCLRKGSDSKNQYGDTNKFLHDVSFEVWRGKLDVEHSETFNIGNRHGWRTS